MENDFYVSEDDGGDLDARFSIDGKDVVFHSRGGAKGEGAVNTDYSKGLLLIVRRLSDAGVPILGAWVDSTTVKSLPLAERSILEVTEGGQSPQQLCSLMSTRMKAVRSDPTSKAKGGNSTKRIRIGTGFNGSPEELGEILGGVPTSGNQRLPAETLTRATPEYIWDAVQQFLKGPVEHSFGPSTDFDMVADDGRRFPPKAVFGIALSLALDGVPIKPKHFTGGETSTCFRLLREAGYMIVPKSEKLAASGADIEVDQDQKWAEGKARLVSHLTRERAKGLSKAKKAQYRRLHGRLTCEKCGIDPVAQYETELAEACIEVHHSTMHVSQMSETHRTTLDDLQCLCANCHRLIHKSLIDAKQ